MDRYRDTKELSDTVSIKVENMVMELVAHVQ